MKIENFDLEKDGVFIIAEMSANHANDINIAKESIIAAANAGADAIKIQTYTADTLTLNCTKPHFEAKGAWEGQTLYDLYQDASMPWEWTKELQQVAKKNNIILFSSPFDFSAVDFLEELNIPAYKIASPEIVDLPLIEKIAKTQKPIILSTGNATLAQIDQAVQTIYKTGNTQLSILKCTSEYPANPKDINLATIPFLKELYKCPIGLSDHTMGNAVPLGSIALGGTIIEKHFILDKSIKTADSFFSCDPKELKELVDGAKMVYDAIGEVKFEQIQKPSQRSLIATANIKKGETLQNGINFKSLRPGGGIESKDIHSIDNRIATKDIEYGDLLSWDMVGGLK